MNARIGPATPLNLLAYLGESPALAGAPLHFGAGAAIVGRVTLGARAWISDSALMRADGHIVCAGDDLHMGWRATVHIAHEEYPALIGARVTVGDFAVVHACEVGDDCVVGDRAVVLDGSVLEAGVVLEDDAVVFPRTRLAGGFVYSGRPARPERPLHAGELAQRHAELRARNCGATHPAPPPSDLHAPIAASVFVANTASLRGHVEAAPRSSIWYGCALDANGGRIALGERSNVQDNSLLSCAPGTQLVIGCDTTIGHNAKMAECTIGDRCLVGIGAIVAAGTRLEDDVVLAAGAHTTPGQVLTGGQIWGGQPVRALAPLDERKRIFFADTVRIYCDYAEEMIRVQARAAPPIAP